MKKYKVSLITLFTAFLTSLLAAVFLLTSAPTAAFAADRYATVDGSNVFYTSIRGAEVTSVKQTTTGESGTEEDHYYTLFRIGADETVSYRNSLAYRWYTGAEQEDGSTSTSDYVERRFSMQIGFPDTNFKRYIVKFQSQQYVKTEDKVSENYLVFSPAEEGRVNVAAVQSLDDEISDYPVSCSAADGAKITVAFAAFSNGSVTVEIVGTDVQGGTLTFKNVYEPYASYVPSGDSAATPLTFSAEFDEDAQAPEDEDELVAQMVLYDLNGQSFELYANSDGVYDQVKDTAPPVMCFNKTPSYVEFGKTLDFDYLVIDVLASSPRATAYFYVLTGDQYDATDFDYSKTDYPDTVTADEDESEEEEGEESGESVGQYANPFVSGSEIRIIRDKNTFIPAKYIEGGSAYAEDYSVYGLIKVYFEISDVSGSTAQSDKVFVDWYAKSDALVNIYSPEYKNQEGKTENFLKIIDGKDGVSYAAATDTTLEEYKQTVRDITERYQQAIDAAIEELGGLYAGSDNNFYLPEFDLLDGDEYFNLTDYKYSIYYKAKSTGSNTSLAFNNLSISLGEADVTYRFTVYITDAFDNPMRYPSETGEWLEITTDDVWDEDFAELLPFFEFKVSYKAATAEPPESQSIAYVGTSYSGISFDINGISGTYTTKYNLYIFDRNAAYNELGIDLTYDEFVENFDLLFNNAYLPGQNTRSYFTTVKPATELQENDPNYDLFKSLNWNATNVSFVPQSAEEFYIVRLTLTDNRSQVSTYNFATVAASVQTTALKGESDWLKNNVASVVLLSIAGVCLIALIVLAIVKPKDKGDIDEVFEKENKKVRKAKK